MVGNYIVEVLRALVATTSRQWSHRGARAGECAQSLRPLSDLWRETRAEEPGRLEPEGEMRCPFCGADDTQVKDSRPTDDRGAIRRRRFCPNCAARFTTFERVQLRELTVIKKHGQREPFDRDKLARSIYIALAQAAGRAGSGRAHHQFAGAPAGELGRNRYSERCDRRPRHGGARQSRPGRLHPFRVGLPQLSRGQGFRGFCRADSRRWQLSRRPTQRHSQAIERSICARCAPHWRWRGAGSARSGQTPQSAASSSIKVVSWVADGPGRADGRMARPRRSAGRAKPLAAPPPMSVSNLAAIGAAPRPAPMR